MEAKSSLDFCKICRICLIESLNMTTLLVPSMIELMSICDLEINDMNELPNQICLNCLERAQSYYSFRQQCKRSEDLLKEMVKYNAQQTYLLVPCDNDLYLTNDDNCQMDHSPPRLSMIETSNQLELEAVDAINKALQEELERRNNADKNSNEIIEFLNDKSIPEINEALANEYLQMIDKQGEEELVDPVQSSMVVDAVALPAVEYFVCEFCNKQFKNKRSYQRHIKRHNEIKPPPSIESHFNILTSEADSLERSTMHLKKFECEVCHKLFGEKSKLNTHKKIHDGVKDYGCSICNKHFTLPWQLKVHLKTHMNQKDFSCPYCNRAFGQNINLQNHIRSKHTLVKPFKCEFDNNCFKAFPTKGELNKHIRKHTGEKIPSKVFCPICSKGCTDNGQLKIHIRSHTKEYNHQCTICNKRYLLHTHLVVHIRAKHTQERPYKCTFENCSKAFYTAQLLAKHSKIHTRTKLTNSENKDFLN